MAASIVRMIRAVSFFAVALSWGGVAEATIWGKVTVTSNTTLTDDVFGNVVVTGSNLVLDCTGHRVHISSRTQTSCFDPSNPGIPAFKCGIALMGGQNVEVRNCVVVGNYPVGVFAARTTNSWIHGVQSAGNDVGFSYLGNDRLFSGALTATTNGRGVVISGDSDDSLIGVSVDSSSIVGISIGDNSVVDTDHLQIIGTSGDGLQIGEGSIVIITSPTIQSNTGTGINMSYSFMRILEGSITGNGLGLFIKNASAAGQSGVSAVNISQNTGRCDASEDASPVVAARVTWTGNNIPHRCGAVPRSD